MDLSQFSSMKSKLADPAAYTVSKCSEFADTTPVARTNMDLRSELNSQSVNLIQVHHE